VIFHIINENTFITSLLVMNTIYGETSDILILLRNQKVVIMMIRVSLVKQYLLTLAYFQLNIFIERIWDKIYDISVIFLVKCNLNILM